MNERKAGCQKQSMAGRSVPWISVSIILFLLIALPATVFPQESKKNEESCHKPAFPSLTYDENNQYLSNSDCRTEIFDRLKFIPLGGSNESFYLSFGVVSRDRGEYFSQNTWGSGPEGNAYLMQRYYGHLDLHLGQRFRLFGEIGSSLETGRNGGPRSGIDEDKLDIHQAFVDLGIWKSEENSLSLRVGRQEMSLGSSSLVATRDGRNIRRSFDGFRLTADVAHWAVDGFALRQSEADTNLFDDSIDHKTSFWGIYGVHALPILPGGHVDLYYMGQDNKLDKYVKGSGREQRETIGTRFWGTTPHWDYNDEFIYQFGRFGAGDISAWSVSTQTGYRLDSIPWKPRLGFKVDAFSGDGNPKGKTLGTFNALYEAGPYFSYAELFGKRDLIDIQPSLRLNPIKRLTLTPNGAFYWRESDQDGLYSVASGAIVVGGKNSTARYIGSHAALQAKLDINRHTAFFTEYLHFFAGDFLRQATAGKDINYWTGWIEFRY
jgi:Alginate export